MQGARVAAAGLAGRSEHVVASRRRAEWHTRPSRCPRPRACSRSTGAARPGAPRGSRRAPRTGGQSARGGGAARGTAAPAQQGQRARSGSARLAGSELSSRPAAGHGRGRPGASQPARPQQGSMPSSLPRRPLYSRALSLGCRQRARAVTIYPANEGAAAEGETSRPLHAPAAVCPRPPCLPPHPRCLLASSIKRASVPTVARGTASLPTATAGRDSTEAAEQMPGGTDRLSASHKPACLVRPPRLQGARLACGGEGSHGVCQIAAHEAARATVG